MSSARLWVCLFRGLFVCGSLAAVGCQTWQKSHSAAIQQFSAGRLAESRAAVQQSQQLFKAERELLILDEAVISLASGDAETAEGLLRGVRRDLEHLAGRDLREQATAALTDDRATAFAGRDFEQQMVLNLLLLSSLLTDAQDSFAYSLQATQKTAERKQTLLAAAQQSAAGAKSAAAPAVIPAGFTPPGSIPAAAGTVFQASTADQPLALAAYLSAAVQSEYPMRGAETEQSQQELSLWNPRYSELAGTGGLGTQCRAGHGTLHVVALIGKAPEWVAESAAPTSAALLLADRILSAAGRHTLPPTIVPVQISRPLPGHPVPRAGMLQCVVQGRTDAASSAPGFPLELLCLVDLDAVARASYQQHRDEQIARAITRRITKKGAIYLLKESQKIHRNSAVDLAINVAGIAWEAAEKPDTRSWRLLPARIDVAHLELPVGEWQTQLASAAHPSAARTVPVHIEDGRNTYVVCFLPEDRLTGRILIGGADRARVPVDSDEAAPAR